jgi:DNA-binding transcriptional LysR family regulator
MPSLLEAFKRLHPKLVVEITVQGTAAILEGLHAGTLEVGFVHAPLEDASLSAEVVGFESYCVALPAAHAMADLQEITLLALAGEAFLVPPADVAPEKHAEIMGLCQRAGFTPKVAGTPSDFAQVLKLVAADQGVCLVPSGLVPSDSVSSDSVPSDSVPADTGVVFVRLSSPSAFLNLLAVRTRQEKPEGSR